jgi:hypothetical protein
MRNMLIAIWISGLLLFGLSLNAITANAQISQTESVQPEIIEKPSSFFGDIEVPYRVLEHVEVEYQGFAIITANRIANSGQNVYMLKISRGLSEIPDKNLLFTADWNQHEESTEATGPSVDSVPDSSNQTLDYLPSQPEQPTDYPSGPPQYQTENYQPGNQIQNNTPNTPDYQADNEPQEGADETIEPDYQESAPNLRNNPNQRNTDGSDPSNYPSTSGE